MLVKVPTTSATVLVITGSVLALTLAMAASVRALASLYTASNCLPVLRNWATASAFRMHMRKETHALARKERRAYEDEIRKGRNTIHQGSSSMPGRSGQHMVRTTLFEFGFKKL